ncbi:MAG: hypothetical protein IPL77_18060 [Flavobacteriales bacterium]|nr:hypothetical protein [Flavobacteriales bacterium]
MADSGYYYGYGAGNQDVVIHFLPGGLHRQERGEGQDRSLQADPLAQLGRDLRWPLRVDPFKKWFRTFTLKHSYRSNFNIGTYQTNLLFDEEGGAVDAANNFIPERRISVVTITEVMRPLLGADVTLQNSLLAKFEYNRDRNMSLSTSNYQVTEVRGKEFVFGTGYRFKNVKFPIEVGGTRPKSDLNLRVDVGIRENNTVIRKIQEGQNQVTAGQNITSIKCSADMRSANA